MQTVNPAFKGTERSCTSVYQNIQRRELVDAGNRVRDADCRGWTINPPMNGKATQLQPAEALISSRVHISFSPTNRRHIYEYIKTLGTI